MDIESCFFFSFFSLVHGGSKFEVFCIFRRFYQPYLLVRRDASINIFNSNDATQYQSCSQALWSLGKICWKWSFQCISSDRQTTLNCQKIFIAGKVLLDCKTKNWICTPMPKYFKKQCFYHKSISERTPKMFCFAIDKIALTVRVSNQAKEINYFLFG